MLILPHRPGVVGDLAVGMADHCLDSESVVLSGHAAACLDGGIAPRAVTGALAPADGPCSQPSPLETKPPGTARQPHFPEPASLLDTASSLDGQDNESRVQRGRGRCGWRPATSHRDSPLSNGTNPDAGYGSPLSDASDRLTDFKSTSSRDGQEREGTALPFRPNNGLSFQDSLAQMKAVYANLISDASWSSITMDIMKSKPAAAGSVNSALTTPEPASTASASTTTTISKSSGVNMTSSHNGRSSSTTVNHTGSASGNTNGTAASAVSSHSATSSSGSSSGGASNGSGVAYDWHQAALAKTLQQTPYHLLPEPSLFSTVQLYRQNNKLYGSVFTGASKFRCKDCSAAYDTLVGLTVHMNETGHYRDDNKDKEEDQGKRWSKPRKRSLMEMEGKEDAQKVLKCMYCGHSFESLQDLSVHMIKTKHYQKVPLKEPVPALPTKLVPTSAKKRAIQDAIVSPCSPDSVHAGSGGGSLSLGDVGKDTKAVPNPYVTPNNRYGYQNGASYTGSLKLVAQILHSCVKSSLVSPASFTGSEEKRGDGGEDERLMVRRRSGGDLKEGLDIQTFENTVSSAISKAQTGTHPHGVYYPSMQPTSRRRHEKLHSASSAPLYRQKVQTANACSGLRSLVSETPLSHPLPGFLLPTPLRSNVTAM
ncbi:teashirt homolog 1, partial [Lates japonicus]